MSKNSLSARGSGFVLFVCFLFYITHASLRVGVMTMWISSNMFPYKYTIILILLYLSAVFQNIYLLKNLMQKCLL